MKSRGTINLIIDFFMLLVFACLGGIGLLIKYKLPPGREQILSVGENYELTFWGWDRHQWGDVHYVVAWVLVALLVLHIFFHWKTVICLVRQAVPDQSLRRAAVVACVVLTAFLLFFSVLLEPQKSGRNDYLFRRQQQRYDVSPQGVGPVIEKAQAPAQPADIPSQPERRSERRKQVEKIDLQQTEHDHPDEANSVQGRMTVAQVARVYEISTAEVKNRLGVPVAVSDGVTLGRLRRQYGFTMTQARDRLEQKQEAAP